MSDTALTPTQVHAVLQKGFDEIVTLRGHIGNDLGNDTAFAIGESLGMIARAKALVGRDIDDAARKQPDP